MGKTLEYLCSSCGFCKDLIIGVGYAFPVEYDRIRKRAYNGEFGEEIRDFLKANPYRVIDAYPDVFVCENCRDISIQTNLGMYVPVDENEETVKKIDKSSIKARNPEMIMQCDLDGKYKKYKDYLHICDKCGGKLRRIPPREYNNLNCPKCGHPLGVGKEIMLWD